MASVPGVCEPDGSNDGESEEDTKEHLQTEQPISDDLPVKS